jgi:VWFA-related protein
MTHRRSAPRRLAAALTVLVLAGTDGLPAQQPAPQPSPSPAAGPPTAPEAPADQPIPQPTFRAGVDLVRVDVTVRGARDLPVDDLQAADFEIEEDGVKHAVETAQFVRLTGARTSDLNDPPQIRSQAHAAMEAAREDVRLFAIFLDDYHIDKEPTITLTLRKNLEEFVAALGPNDLVAMMEPLTPLTSLTFTRDRNALLAWVKQFEGRRGQVFPVKSPAEEEQLRRSDLRLVRAEVTYNALEAIVTRLGGLKEGRKSVLFVSQGPPSWDSMNRVQPLLQAVLTAANRGSVMVHALDPRSLGAPNGGDENTLRILAGETGGRAIVNTNDPTEQLDGVIEDQSAYYLLGYTPQRTRNDGKFHKIAVRAKRGGLRVTARKGYWAAAEEEMTAASRAAATPSMPGLGKALDSLASGNTPSALEVWTGASRAGDGHTRLTVTWEPGRLALQGESPRAAQLTVEPLSAADGTTALAEPREIGEAHAATFDLPPGPIKLRLTALDGGGGTIDRWTRALIVPAFSGDGVALATLRFLRARSPAQLRVLEATPDPAPAATRSFRRTERVLVDIPYYASGETPAISAELLGKDGRTLTTLTVPAPAGGRARLPLPVGSLAPGTYVLKVIANAGGAQAEQLAAFSVAQ